MEELDRNQSRRSFLRKGLAGTFALAAAPLAASASSLLSSDSSAEGKSSGRQPIDTGKVAICSQGDTAIRIYSSKVTTPVKLLVISDTHLWMSDSREDPYREYSQRMSKAYNVTKNFQTLRDSNPTDEFKRTMERAVKMKPDAIFHLGDLVSYPSEAGIEWAKQQLDGTGIPYYFTNGNHDWHYEGMEGSDIDLRREWTEKRLRPLFRDFNPLLYSVDVKGLKVLMLDDSVYEILPEQLEIFRSEMKKNQPSLMMSHIPLYAPGFPVNWGCGHPEWNWDHDRNWKLERRERWPKEGHKKVTYDFWNAVQEAHSKHNLLATFAGHVHQQSSSQVGWPQFTVKANLSGAFYEVNVLPMP